MKDVHHSQPGYPKKLAAKHTNRPISIHEIRQRWFYRARGKEVSSSGGINVYPHGKI